MGYADWQEIQIAAAFFNCWWNCLKSGWVMWMLASSTNLLNQVLQSRQLK